MEGLGELDGHVLGGRYRLGEKLGQGGMGAVYSAMQTSLGRKVAIKVLLPVLSSDPGLVARFRTEAEQAGRLNHPNIVQVLDFGQEDDGSVWIAMEILEGEALADRIERGPMSEADVVKMAKETLAGLEAAHGHRLVHRDLKPDNIFISSASGIGEVVKILDFGIAKLLDGDAAAKLTATGLIIGTPLYMSPEQARGEDLDQRSDLYSLAAVMYEALTGQPPFTGRNYNALLVAVLTSTPRPIHELRPDITPALAEVVMRALDKDASNRFVSAQEMGAALSTFTPKTETPPSPQELGLASTMATPTPQVGSTEPKTTPVAGGVGPAPAQAGGAMAAAGATTEPMTEVAEAAPKPAARRHGWLVPAMVAVALLAGVGGTMTFMQTMGEDAEPMVAMGEPGTMGGTPAATVTPVTPVSPVAPEPTRPMVPAGGLDTQAAMGSATGNGRAGSEGEETGTSEPAAAPTKAAPMRRVPRVNILIRGATYSRHREWRQHIDGHANWSSCWPRGREVPTVSRGLSIAAHTTPDGTLSNFAVQGNNNYPDIATCLIGLLRGGSYGPADDGQGHDVVVSFTFSEARPRMGRR